MHRSFAILSEIINYPDQKSKLQHAFLPCIIITLCIMLAGCRGKSEHSQETAKMSPQDLAFQYMQENRLDEAEAAFIQAIEANPRDLVNYNELSSLYLLKKNYDEAEKEATKGLVIKPDNADLRLILVEALTLKGNREQAVNELKKLIDQDPRNVRAYYKMAGIGPSDPDQTWKKTFLLKVISLAPANLVPRLQLAELLAGSGQSDSSLYYLQSIKKIASEFSPATETLYQKAVGILQGNQPAKALPFIKDFHDLMKVTPEYASDDEGINLLPFIAGYPQFTSSQFSQGLSAGPGDLLHSMKFTDASKDAGLLLGSTAKADRSVLAIADYNEKGNIYIYASFQSGSSATGRHLFTNKTGGGALEECKACADFDLEGEDFDAAFADYDNDGYQDLFLFTTKGVVLYRNQGDGNFSKIKEDIGLSSTGIVRKVLFADFDQDGDLDLYVAQKGGNKFFRNNGDGTFSEQAGQMGLIGNPLGTISMDYGDWDGDGDLDIVALGEKGEIQLFNNNRHSNFKDISDSAGLKNSPVAGSVIAFGDYNNDGATDIFVAGGVDGKCLLYKNDGDHGFVIDSASNGFGNLLQGIKVYDATFFDFDNDGRLDLLVAGVSEDNTKRGIRLFHNDSTKGFSDATYLLPQTATEAHHIAIDDFNLDGDEDIFLTGPNGVQLLRNDGGNMNHFLQVQLVGLTYGNSRNNRLGIGALVEAKSGNLYQMKTVKRPLVQLGIGARDSVDAIRIVWPNGVPQTIVDPSRQERLIEQEKLKGSCPFLFTWNGKKYEFVKDMLWRSALGMPLAFHGKDTSYAFCDASKEYLLIPGEKLKPKNGLYSIKITEELWEAVYFDKAALVAVDHPDSIDTYVDERFVLPPFPGKKIYRVADKYLPVSATDGKGNDLLPKISRYDFQYASNFSPGKFQGLAEDHELILNLGDKANADSLLLFLRGWVYPTDASINTSMAQSQKYKVRAPSIQVINTKGEWETVIKNMGYPMGRDKMVIADLTGKFLTANDRRIKISTNMQIYWDHIFFTTGTVKSPARMTDVKMVSAKLGYRGYSESYRKGGPYGPEWLDYYTTTKGQKWRDLTGYYTRYGDVLPLLKSGDDQYIIANSGDEISIDFDAKRLPVLPKGWKRDFLIYSEGWVKDGDLNTAYGQTVEPLPFHKMPVYPYNKDVVYPADEAHKRYRQKYNTRKITTLDFKNALKPGSIESTQKTIR
jgi:tetratricopeptide (TPR) repeat protein